MRRAAAPLLLVALAGCVTSVSSSSSSSSSSLGSLPAASARRVLVEVRGSAPEAEAFAARFLYEASERGVALVDARISGGHLADLSDPASEASRKLRESFPGDSYIAVEVGACEVFSRTTTMPGAVDPMTGIRTTDVIGGVDTTCAASLTETGADGKTLRSASVEGHAAVTGSPETREDPRLEAVRDAATAAAKKLFGKRR